MDNKTITEFDFHMTWRIMQIPEAIIHLKSSSICIITHIILNLIQQLLNSPFKGQFLCCKTNYIFLSYLGTVVCVN